MTTQPEGVRWTPPIHVYAIVPARPSADASVGAALIANRLGTIATDRFAAVVGDGTPAASPGWSREELATQLLAHQRTIEQIMQATPLLPVKFATFVPDETSVRALLERGGPAFEAAFRQLDGCVQLEVLVRWDIKAVFTDIANEEAVARLKERLEREAGAADAASRAELGRLVKDALERRRAALAAPLFEALRAVAVDAIAYPATTDQMVLHLVLLVKADDMSALDRCLEALDTAQEGRLAFRCVGPFAPYSFATVEVEVVDAAAMAQARLLLEVGPNASVEEVRTAYRRIAKTIHPDLAGPAAGNSESMASLAEAYRVLSLNAEADDRQRRGEEAGPAGSAHSAGRSVHVFVRRQEHASDVAA